VPLTRASLAALAVAATGLVALAAALALRGDGGAAGAGPPPAALPTDGPALYKVEYLGITCGHMVLSSELGNRAGRPAYHIVMTARNSKFFNKIYRVDGRIESWVDAASLSTLSYESDITEKGERKVRRYRIDGVRGVLVAERDGKVSETPYRDGGLDPLAFIFRGRLLAGYPGTSFAQRLLTDKGAIDTVSTVVSADSMGTPTGRRTLLQIRAATADGELFSRKGEFAYWVDPGEERTLHVVDFKLGFGRLTARLEGPAEGHLDRRPPAQ